MKQELKHIEDLASIVGDRPFAFICIAGDLGIVREGEDTTYYLPPRLAAELLNHKCGVSENEKLRLMSMQLRRESIGDDENNN